MFDITKEELENFEIPHDLAERMMPFLHFKKVHKNEVLVDVDDICDSVYIVRQGGLILSHINRYNWEEKVVNFYLPSLQPFCTVTDSYFQNKKTECKLTAYVDSKIYYFKKPDIENKIKTDPKILKFYLDKLNDGLVFENNLRMKLITLSTEQFYKFLLLEHPEIIKNVPAKYIAQFMGISREWLSKIK